MTVQVSAPACPRCGKRGVRTHDEWVCLDHGTFVTPRRAWDPSGFDQADAAKVRGVSRIRARPPGTGSIRVLPWSERELEEWASWQEGDPLPDWAGGGVSHSQSLAERRSAKVAALLEAGTEVDTIAEQLGVSRRTVYRHFPYMKKETVMTQPTNREELTAADLVRLTKNRAEHLQSVAQKALRTLEQCQEEASKLQGFLRAMGEEYELPEELRGARRAPKVASKRAVQACDQCDYVGVGLGIHRSHKHGKVAL